MKIVTVVGARPQFIKAAIVSRTLRKSAKEVLLHTGQHHDHNMSGIFFEELSIPRPDYNLGISGGNHGSMTGAMLSSIEEVLIKERPDAVLVYGDTNSTLAGALAAVKLSIPVCHVEAGVRLGTLRNPEEANRICTDHVSSLLLYCTESAENHLAAEGLLARARLVGDPMYDAFVYYGGVMAGAAHTNITGLDGKRVELPGRYYYLTCHRQENTADDATLTEILKAMNSLDFPTVYPVHPRNQARALRIAREKAFDRIILAEPASYLTSLALLKGADKVVTDSGGLQREAFFAGKQCVTVFDSVIWPETMVGNRNQLAKPDAGDIAMKLREEQTVDPSYMPFGNAHSAEMITKLILEEMP